MGGRKMNSSEKNTMKIFSFLAAAMLGFGCLAEYIAETGEYVTETGGKEIINVDEDVVLEGKVRLSSRATVEKGGAGKLTLATGNFTEQEDIAIAVAKGSVEVKATDSVLAEYAKPTEVMNKAAFWVDSTVNLATDKEGGVDAWYDVRETKEGIDASSFKYTRAVPFLNEKLTAKPLAQSYQEKPGVYCRGYGNGCFMNWLKSDGNQAKITSIRHVFIVHGGPTSRGDILGQCKGNSPDFQRAGQNEIWATHSGENIAMHASRTYLNGVQIDPHTTVYPQNAIHVVEVQTFDQTLGAMCFFNDRDMQLKATDGQVYTNEAGQKLNPILGDTSQTADNRAGGEYIFEVLIFTNSLTATERLDVSNYLRQKWLDATPPGAEHKSIVSLGSGTTLQFNGESSPENLSVKGDGTLVANGPARLRSKIETRNDKLGFNIASGTFNLLYQIPYNATAGETVAVERTYYGEVYSVASTAGDSSTFTKTGAGTLTLDKIPEGVTKLAVESGSLILAAPEKELNIFPNPADVYAVAIPNADFEGLHDGGSKHYNWKDNGSTFGANGAWHAIVPAQVGNANSGVMIFDQRLGDPPGGWNMVLQSERTTVLVLKNQASAWCEIDVEREGVYVLSFDSGPRSGQGGRQIDIMIGPDSDNLQMIAEFQAYNNTWRKYTYGNIYLKAGKYQLWFKNLMKNDDRCNQFDNISLELVPPRHEWLIPNGDFEDFSPPLSNGNYLDNTNKVSGFTLTQASILRSIAKDTGDRSTNTTFVKVGGDYDKFTNRPWNRPGSQVQLYMADTGAKMETSFYPPAGSWRLAADVGIRKFTYHQQGNYVMKATIDFGNGEISLGAITNTSLALLKREWPVPFTSDGKTMATIVIETEIGKDQYCGQANIDNITLVSMVGHGKNLFVNPGFEESADSWVKDWSRVVTPKPEKVGGTMRQPYSDSSNYYNRYFGIDEFEGTNCIKIVNDDSVYQTITFPEGGLYRFSANVESRCNISGMSFGNGTNPVRFYMAQGGKTNWLGVTDAEKLTNFVEKAVVFRVPEGGGTWDVGLRGTKVWGGSEDFRVDETAMVDGVQLYKIESEGTLAFPEKLEIELGAGAKLTLDFDGTNTISRLKVNGRARSGVLTAENAPDIISGRGALLIVPRFFTITVR